MRYTKLLGVLSVAATGLVLSCATAKAEDPYRDRRDLRHDYAKVDRLRADIARDQWRLDQDLRAGRERAASHEARDIARDQRKVDRQLRDIQRDRADIYRDRRDRW